jgi:CBS domain-containing protein
MNSCGAIHGDARLIRSVHWAAKGRTKSMTVKAVVCRKGTDVVTIDPTTLLANAVKTLATHRIGALIITGADQQVDGILSERDIVRALAERGSSALEEPVGQVMTRKILA